MSSQATALEVIGVKQSLSRMCGMQEAYHANKGVHQLDLNILNGDSPTDLCIQRLLFLLYACDKHQRDCQNL